jgi:hypothetical protein
MGSQVRWSMRGSASSCFFLFTQMVLGDEKPQTTSWIEVDLLLGPESVRASRRPRIEECGQKNNTHECGLVDF